MHRQLGSIALLIALAGISFNGLPSAGQADFDFENPDGRTVIPGLPPAIPGSVPLQVAAPVKGKIEVSNEKSQKQAKPLRVAKSKSKPVVHFPADVLPRPDETSRGMTAANDFGDENQQGMVLASASPQTAGQSDNSRLYYPKGYLPYAPPTAVEQQYLHAKAVTHFNRGNYYGRRDKVDDAISEYRKAIVLDPAFADARVALSTAYIQKNDWENVIEEARKALKLHQNFMDANNILRAKYNLSAAYCVTDEYGKAKRYYKEVRRNSHPLTTQLQAYLQHNCKP